METLLLPAPIVNFGLYDDTSFNNAQPKCLQWKHPPAGFFALNCDGSFRALKGTGGYGVVVRDHLGRFVTAKADHFQWDDLVELKKSPEIEYGVIVLMIEMLAILDGLQMAKTWGLKYVAVQSDSKISVSILVGNARCPRQCLGILSEIKSELSFFKRVGFVFIYRERNRAADFLSKLLTSDEEKCFTMSELPYPLQRIIIEDALGYFVVRNAKKCGLGN